MRGRRTGLGGIVRWVVMAHTTDVAALPLIQPLYGFTFAHKELARLDSVTRVGSPLTSWTA
jgi:hypothetical protein